MKFSGKVGNGPLNNWLNFGGDPDHRLNTGIVFRIHHYWEIAKAVSTDCAERCCSARHTPAGIAIATTTLLRHRSTTDSRTDITTLARRALVEVCTVPVLLVSYRNFFNQVSTMRYDVVHYIVCNANVSPFIIVMLACRDGKCLLHCCYLENAKAEFNCGTRISYRGCLATINGRKKLSFQRVKIAEAISRQNGQVTKCEDNETLWRSAHTTQHRIPSTQKKNTHVQRCFDCNKEGRQGAYGIMDNTVSQHCVSFCILIVMQTSESRTVWQCLTVCFQHILFCQQWCWNDLLCI